MSEVRIGVIGVGIIGKSHLDEYAKIPVARVVAVADIDEAEARRVAEKYEIPHVYADFVGSSSEKRSTPSTSVFTTIFTLR